MSGKKLEKADANSAKANISSDPGGCSVRCTVAVPRRYFVLVDGPLEPQDTLVFTDGVRRPIEKKTKAAADLADTNLVHALEFEEVGDGRAVAFSLKLERGESQAAVELFSNVESTDLFQYDSDLIIEGRATRSNKRLLYDNTIEPRPIPDDEDLDWPDRPYASVTQSGS